MKTMIQKQKTEAETSSPTKRKISFGRGKGSTIAVSSKLNGRKIFPSKLCEMMSILFIVFPATKPFAVITRA